MLQIWITKLGVWRICEREEICEVENFLKLALLKLETDEWSASGGTSIVFIIFIKKIEPLAQTRNLGAPDFQEHISFIPDFQLLLFSLPETFLPQSPEPASIRETPTYNNPPRINVILSLHHGTISFSMFPLFTESLLFIKNSILFYLKRNTC